MSSKDKNVRKGVNVTFAEGEMGDWGRIILSPEAASSRFHDKVLVLTSGQTITISRSSAGEKPETENAVFDCRVSYMT